jgi:hypothetical protein
LRPGFARSRIAINGRHLQAKPNALSGACVTLAQQRFQTVRRRWQTAPDDDLDRSIRDLGAGQFKLQRFDKRDQCGAFRAVDYKPRRLASIGLGAAPHFE